MYAIVDIAGQQFKIEKGQEVYVHRLEGKEGSKIDFGQVLLMDNDGKVNVGTPFIEGALVTATIIEHLKGNKVLVFKKKRRKGYQKLNGHRQYLSLIKIDSILEKGAKSTKAKAEVKEEVKEEKVPKAASKAPEKTTAATKTTKKVKAEAGEVKKEKKPVAKKPAAKTAVKKAVVKKAAVKKATVKKAAPKATTTKKPAAKKAEKPEEKENKK